MLADDLETIIPKTLPSKGFRVHRAELQGHRAAAWRDVSPGREDRAARGVRHLLQPEPDEHVHVPDQQPAAGRGLDIDVRPVKPQHDAVVRSAHGRRRRRARARHDLADAASSERAQGSVELRRPARARARTALDLQYVGSHTQHLDRSFFNNTPQPGPGAVDPRRPTQKFKSRRIIQNDLIADYDAVSLILRKRMSHGLQADVHYTWSKTMDMATHSNGGGQTMNNYDIWADYGPANWDVPHRFVASYIYDVPFFKNSSHPAAQIRGGRLGDERRHDGSERLDHQRHAQRRPGEHRDQRPAAAESGRRGAHAQLPAAREQPGTGQLFRFDGVRPARRVYVRQRPRNILRGPKSIVTDLSLMKNFPLGGGRQFQFRAEIFNAFNTVNYGNPNGVFNSTSFGRISSAGSMRQIQLGARVSF